MWRSEAGAQCRVCARRIANSAQLRKEAQSGALEKKLATGSDYLGRWLQDIHTEETAWEDKKGQGLQHDEGPSESFQAVSYNEGKVEQLCAVFWPDWVYARERHAELTEDASNLKLKASYISVCAQVATSYKMELHKPSAPSKELANPSHKATQNLANHLPPK